MKFFRIAPYILIFLLLFGPTFIGTVQIMNSWPTHQDLAGDVAVICEVFEPVSDEPIPWIKANGEGLPTDAWVAINELGGLTFATPVPAGDYYEISMGGLAPGLYLVTGREQTGDELDLGNGRLIFVKPVFVTWCFESKETK